MAPGLRTTTRSTLSGIMNRLEWIALAWHGGIGPAAFYKLLRRFGSPRAVAEASADELRAARARLSDGQIERLRASMEAVPPIEEGAAELSEEGVTVVCSFEDAYPPPLLDLQTAPPVLCLHGEWHAADREAVAIVGTRSPSVEGERLAEALALECARAGITVVSGLARGIDTCAHRGALAGGGRTVAVLGSGVRVIRPAENIDLARRIVQSGAVVSELPPRARPSVRSLMARNRLQSGLSKAVVVVESREQGGSLQTARYALRQGRLLFAVDWPDAKPTAAGTRTLLRKGALPVRGLDDVSELIRQVRRHVPGPPPSRSQADRRQLPLW